MAESRRVDDLRRRVREDPASIVFAQLAEEYRRAGRFREAVAVCRAGLVVHPVYHSARVTLARALMALESEDDARRELQQVLAAAPDHLAALKTLADLEHRGGNLETALRMSRIAHDLSPGDVELQRAVRAIETDVAQAARPAREGAVQRDRALRTIARLEDWLSAIHGTRAHRDP